MKIENFIRRNQNSSLSAHRSTKVISLISLGHFVSHFYMLLIPPLFPMLKAEFDVSYTELGIAIAAFSIVT